jgi:hypothetical protein
MVYCSLLVMLPCSVSSKTAARQSAHRACCNTNNCQCCISLTYTTVCTCAAHCALHHHFTICVVIIIRCVFQWRHEVEAESGASPGSSITGTALSSSNKRDSFDEDPLVPLMFNSDAGGGDM